ncbi:MAG: hypothetical protein A2Y66_06800 [Nitrospirae bacterium RBG_13_41_22]|nr:MAG: hypothetical protein A2Y66_06800 [Nitrospirae bacterium RBG_13_41_22]
MIKIAYHKSTLIQNLLRKLNLSPDIFHHKMDNKNMKVVEKDKVISGMLQDELKRCREMLQGKPKGHITD